MVSRQKIIRHLHLGTVTLRKLRQSRNLKISVRAEGVLVTMPLYTSFSEAEGFLDNHVDWALQAMKRLADKKAKTQTTFTPETEFGTYSRKVQLIPAERHNVHVDIRPGLVEVYYPAARQINDPALQATIRKAVEYAWRVEAREVLPARLQQLAAQHGFRYKKLSIRSSRTCWGSCSPDNTINLSLHLMHLPDHLIDYIILHELCHTVHKNHGDAFWDLLGRVTQKKAREYARQLRAHSTRIY
ncbi:MAG: M48 family metallopeptidase [Prevotellaceae bacterium]|jgi:predicted metal-dependent hydrolase|nr:M48 family metallopeptidase [Prevotellaceae bacterium]